jgi:hypothetical protein
LAAPIADCVLFRLRNAYENNLQQSKVINIKVVGLCAPSGYNLWPDFKAQNNRLLPAIRKSVWPTQRKVFLHHNG